MKTQIINNDIQQKQLEGQILETSQLKRDNSNSKSLNIDADINRLLGEIQEWKRIYLLVTPIAGKVSMTRVWSPQQFVNSNEEVLTIVPNNTNVTKKTNIIGKALFAHSRFGQGKNGAKCTNPLGWFSVSRIWFFRSPRDKYCPRTTTR